MGKCAFRLYNNEAPRKMSKKDSTSEKKKNNVAIVRIYPKLGCVSQDVELPEQTVDLLTYELETVLLEEERQEISTERISNSNTRTLRKESSTFGNKWDLLWKLSTVDRSIIATQHAHSCGQRSKQQAVGRRWCQKSSLTMDQEFVKKISRNVLCERSYILQAKDANESSTFFQRQS